MVKAAASTRPILMADDDEDDCLMTKRALERNKVGNPFITVPDGEALLEFIQGGGDENGQALPIVILLDLNMPRMNGREALRRLKADRRLRRIPVVVFSTSQSEEDIQFCYESGANSYIAKVFSFEELVKVIESFKNYWLGTVELPANGQT